MLTPLCSGDLLRLIEAHGAMSEAQAAAVMRATLHALTLLHGIGVCHLDVKPQNLLYRRPSPPSPRQPQPHGGGSSACRRRR